MHKMHLPLESALLRRESFKFYETSTASQVLSCSLEEILGHIHIGSDEICLAILVLDLLLFNINTPMFLVHCPIQPFDFLQ